MKNVNQRRNYSNFKYFNDVCATALHESTDKFLGDEGAVIRTGGEKDFVRLDRTELRQKIVDRNRRKLDILAKRIETEELVSRLLGSITALKSPEESKPNG
jgi:hypothetical protein